MLGEVELAVLGHLWANEECEVMEAHAAVGRPRGITPNTIGSALERLHRKGLASRRKVSHAYRYRATLSRDELAARRVVDAAGGVRALTSPETLSVLVDLLDRAALGRLESLIAAKRRERARRPNRRR